MYLNESTTAELLERAARAAPAHPFLVTDQGALTYAQTVTEVDQVAAGLERFGIRRGDRVVVLMNSRLEYPLAVFALHVLGATAVNVNPAYSPEELQYVCTQGRARALIADAEFAANVRAACLRQPVVWIGSSDVSGSDIAWQALRRESGDVNLRRAGVTPDDPADEAGKALHLALLDAGVPPKDVDIAACATVYEGPFQGQRVLMRLGMNGIPVINVENACSSGSTGIVEAARWIQAGAADVAVVVGVERLASKFASGPIPLDESLKTGSGSAAADPFVSQGMTFPITGSLPSGTWHCTARLVRTGPPSPSKIASMARSIPTPAFAKHRL